MSAPPEPLLRFVPAELLCQSRTRLSCPENVIELWGFDLGAADTLLAWCRGLLSADETQRADRFVFEKHRRYFTVARATLRCILSRYLNESPASLVFRVTPAGKPHLAQPSAAKGFAFNLSHSADRALLAVGMSELGVDIEKIRPNLAARELGSRYFAPSEQAIIEASADAEVADVFFRYWVAKESVLKAQGTGLGFDLHRFAVHFDAAGLNATVTSEDAQLLSPDWRSRLLRVGPGWTAAVCARGGDWQIRFPSPDAP